MQRASSASDAQPVGWAQCNPSARSFSTHRHARSSTTNVPINCTAHPVRLHDRIDHWLPYRCSLFCRVGDAPRPPRLLLRWVWIHGSAVCATYWRYRWVLLWMRCWGHDCGASHTSPSHHVTRLSMETRVEQIIVGHQLHQRLWNAHRSPLRSTVTVGTPIRERWASVAQTSWDGRVSRSAPERCSQHECP